MKRLFFFLLSFAAVYSSFTTPIEANGIYTTEKLITVDLYKQKVFVWEGGRLINQSYASTGLWQTPTPRGSFRIYWKLPTQTMSGGSTYYGSYYLPNVPAVMYFYQGYALHGAYWHNSFGRRMSHGCVNLPVSFSKWLYRWADVGTRIEIF